MQAGVDFENDIRYIAESDLIETSENEVVNEIAEIVKGGVWQKTCSRELGNYLLYGRMDVWTPYKIYDIKRTTKKFKNKIEFMKYKYSIQHLLYMYCTGVELFDYLISDGKELMIESYNYDEHLEPVLKERIDEMIDFIFYVPEFREAFEKNWKARERKSNAVLIRLDEIRRGLLQ